MSGLKISCSNHELIYWYLPAGLVPNHYKIRKRTMELADDWLEWHWASFPLCRQKRESIRLHLELLDEVIDGHPREVVFSVSFLFPSISLHTTCSFGKLLELSIVICNPCSKPPTIVGFNSLQVFMTISCKLIFAEIQKKMDVLLRYVSAYWFPASWILYIYLYRRAH